MKLFRQLEPGEKTKLGDLWVNNEAKRMEEIDHDTADMTFDPSIWSPIFRPIKIDETRTIKITEES